MVGDGEALYPSNGAGTAARVLRARERCHPFHHVAAPQRRRYAQPAAPASLDGVSKVDNNHGPVRVSRVARDGSWAATCRCHCDFGESRTGPLGATPSAGGQQMSDDDRNPGSTAVETQKTVATGRARAQATPVHGPAVRHAVSDARVRLGPTPSLADRGTTGTEHSGKATKGPLSAPQLRDKGERARATVSSNSSDGGEVARDGGEAGRQPPPRKPEPNAGASSRDPAPRRGPVALPFEDGSLARSADDAVRRARRNYQQRLRARKQRARRAHHAADAVAKVRTDPALGLGGSRSLQRVHSRRALPRRPSTAGTTNASPVAALLSPSLRLATPGGGSRTGRSTRGQSSLPGFTVTSPVAQRRGSASTGTGSLASASLSSLHDAPGRPLTGRSDAHSSRVSQEDGKGESRPRNRDGSMSSTFLSGFDSSAAMPSPRDPFEHVKSAGLFGYQHWQRQPGAEFTARAKTLGRPAVTLPGVSRTVGELYGPCESPHGGSGSASPESSSSSQASEGRDSLQLERHSAAIFHDLARASPSTGANRAGQPRPVKTRPPVDDVDIDWSLPSSARTDSEPRPSSARQRRPPPTVTVVVKASQVLDRKLRAKAAKQREAAADEARALLLADTRRRKKETHVNPLDLDKLAGDGVVSPTSGTNGDDDEAERVYIAPGTPASEREQRDVMAEYFTRDPPSAVVEAASKPLGVSPQPNQHALLLAHDVARQMEGTLAGELGLDTPQELKELPSDLDPEATAAAAKRAQEQRRQREAAERKAAEAGDTDAESIDFSYLYTEKKPRRESGDTEASAIRAALQTNLLSSDLRLLEGDETDTSSDDSKEPWEDAGDDNASEIAQLVEEVDKEAAAREAAREELLREARERQQQEQALQKQKEEEAAAAARAAAEAEGRVPRLPKPGTWEPEGPILMPDGRDDDDDLRHFQPPPPTPRSARSHDDANEPASQTPAVPTPDAAVQLPSGTVVRVMATEAVALMRHMGATLLEGEEAVRAVDAAVLDARPNDAAEPPSSVSSEKDSTESAILETVSPNLHLRRVSQQEDVILGPMQQHALFQEHAGRLKVEAYRATNHDLLRREVLSKDRIPSLTLRKDEGLRQRHEWRARYVEELKSRMSQQELLDEVRRLKAKIKQFEHDRPILIEKAKRAANSEAAILVEVRRWATTFKEQFRYVARRCSAASMHSRRQHRFGFVAAELASLRLVPSWTVS